jgi:hypothetical protein
MRESVRSAHVKVVRLDYNPNLFAVMDDEYREGDERNVRYTSDSRHDCNLWLDGYYAAQTDYGD